MWGTLPINGTVPVGRVACALACDPQSHSALACITTAPLGPMPPKRDHRLALATLRFGNGLPHRTTEFAISIFGIVAALLVAWFVAGSPIGSASG